MVGMAVGKDDGMSDWNLLADELQPQFGRCVNQKGAAGDVNGDASPHSIVTRIRRATDVAVAADHWHAGAGARS